MCWWWVMREKKIQLIAIMLKGVLRDINRHG